MTAHPALWPAAAVAIGALLSLLLMGVLVLAMIPVIVFYLASQKHIIRGIVAGDRKSVV